MRIVGLTGGIATGKSTVSKAIVDLQFPLIDCDQIAKDVVKKGRWGHSRVVAGLGSDILLPNGELDRAKIGHLVFNDPELRKKLNKATHVPVFLTLIWKVFLQWLLCRSVVVIDMPLLFETNFQKRTSFTILVTCSQETQLKRLMLRDGSSEEQAQSRIRSQMPQENKTKLADEIVDNDGSREDTLRQVTAILRRRVKPSFMHSILLSPAALVFMTALIYGYLRVRCDGFWGF